MRGAGGRDDAAERQRRRKELLAEREREMSGGEDVGSGKREGGIGRAGKEGRDRGGGVGGLEGSGAGGRAGRDASERTVFQGQRGETQADSSVVGGVEEDGGGERGGEEEGEEGVYALEEKLRKSGGVRDSRERVTELVRMMQSMDPEEEERKASILKRMLFTMDFQQSRIVLCTCVCIF